MGLLVLRRKIFLRADKMKNAKILFLMFSLCCASISAATVAIQVETHFNTPCFALRGYWIPESRLNIRFTENHAANTLIIPSTQTVNHKDILYFCENNQIDKLISAYQQLQSDSNAVELLKVRG